MTKDEICGLLRQIHDVLAMQSETNFVPQQPACNPNHIPDVKKMEPVATCNGMPAYEGPLSKSQRKLLTHIENFDGEDR